MLRGQVRAAVAIAGVAVEPQCADGRIEDEIQPLEAVLSRGRRRGALLGLAGRYTKLPVVFPC